MAAISASVLSMGDQPGRQRIERSLVVDPSLAGSRLDQALAELMPELSRSRLQQWIDAGQVLVDAVPRRRRDKVWGGESIDIRADLVIDDGLRAQDIAIDVVFEDSALLVINKPAGMVVHPAAGNPDGTLLNALLHHAPELGAVPRAGIVHRLDKDTSGLLVVAKTLEAHKSLVGQLQARRAHREYRALVVGHLVSGGRVDAPIGRHPVQRVKMAVTPSGRDAVTHYRVLESYGSHTLLAVELETGRTHQIRVHMASVRHPLVGDPAYGGKPRPPQGCSPLLRQAVQQFPRQALHAIRLGLVHPQTHEEMEWDVPMADDLESLLNLFRQEARGGSDPA